MEKQGARPRSEACGYLLDHRVVDSQNENVGGVDEALRRSLTTSMNGKLSQVGMHLFWSAVPEADHGTPSIDELPGQGLASPAKSQHSDAQPGGGLRRGGIVGLLRGGFVAHWTSGLPRWALGRI